MTINNSKSAHISFLILLCILCYARIYLINIPFWDDNCWLLSLYNSNSLEDFLNTGFRELRRVPNGTFLYYLTLLHKETEVFFPVFHTVNIVLQTGTIIFVYLMVQKVFKNSFIALCVALIALLYPVDTTTPIFSTLAYRSGLFLGVFSVYTSAAAIGETVKWRLIAVSLLSTAVAQYIFIEGVIALEPARMLIIWHLLSAHKTETRQLRRTLFTIAGLFFLMVVPLVYYKLMYKPYGIYAGTYQSDPLFLIRLGSHWRAFSALFFINWLFFSKYLSSHILSLWSLFLGLFGILAGYLYLSGFKSRILEGVSTACKHSTFATACRDNSFVFLLGFAFYLPPVLMYEFAGRVVFTGYESRHGTLLVIGFALIWGGLLHTLYAVSQTSLRRARMVHILLALFIGIGVFFHNVNHDLYLASQNDQKRFWQAFAERLPVLPEKAAFLFDVEMPPSLYGTPFYVYYGIEFHLNMLYARTGKGDVYNRYIAAPISYWQANNNLSAVFSKRHAGTGHPYTDEEPLFVIQYRNGKILVNSEIEKANPGIAYKEIFSRAQSVMQ